MSSLWWRLVRFGFYLLYNHFAFTYDLVSWVVSMGDWRSWQRAALIHANLRPGQSVLELAYGTGNLQLDLHAAGFVPYGHDLSPFMARLASGKLRKAGYPVRLSRGMAQSLPYPGGAFPVLISTFPTNFIFETSTLQEAWRVLSPDGRLVIVPNGELTSGGVSERAIEGLYRLTGQREAEGDFEGALVRFFARHHFQLTIERVPCPRSIATVLIAEKMANSL